MNRELVTVGWRAVGLVKQRDGTRILGPIHPRMFAAKAAAEEVVELAKRVDPELKPYLVEVKKVERETTHN